MKIEVFEMERMQSTWENVVDFDMSESGVLPVTLREMTELGFDLERALDTPLTYSQSNGTPELREALSKVYPGSGPDNFEVTNGTSEANYLAALSQLREGDEFALEVPNYMQLWGVPRSLGAKVNRFHLRPDRGWEPDWDEFEQAVNPRTRMVYVSNPNNPTGAVLGEESMRRIVERCDEMDAWLIADEVYLGAEIEADRTQSFWGMSDRVIVTSGLSKAYGIPGVRIGWIVGPEDLVADTWSQHDSLTICPSKLSDALACIAVRQENRDRLYARGRQLLQRSLASFSRWVEDLGEGFSFVPPTAGAIGFVRYASSTPSLELCQQILRNQSTLVVPGIHFGLEGYLRIWLGARPEYMAEGLARLRAELQAGGLVAAAAGA
ncbi:MAG: aminotransferase class I/II-fold pyridoxal phosphate-dependent enzyme [Acidobacteriota bacterium]|nr:aminotransferase class I/II-fold pyridoxal phosphate-dependent enzyme [Acidobacteriota bacterium]